MQQDWSWGTYYPGQGFLQYEVYFLYKEEEQMIPEEPSISLVV